MPEKKNIKLSKSLRMASPLEEKRTWILLAQRTKAKLVEHFGRGKPLRMVGGFLNPTGELQTHELVSDRPGRVYNLAAGSHRNTTSPSEDAREHSLTLFARDLATTVEEGIANGKCDRVVIVAEPHCMGRIKKSLSPAAKKRLAAAINKDLFLLDDKELYAQLEPVLR